ncbi:hypothetical protein ACFL6W_05485 [Thermodesulfobacteriota bacterium]
MSDKSKKKPPYSTPMIMPLADLSEGSGQVEPNCTFGSSAAARCQNGSSADSRCLSGNYAGAVCSMGNNFVPLPANCKLGNGATKKCSIGLGFTA